MDQFCSELVANSESKWFLSALREWEHVETFLEEEEGTCICGHVIKEHCIIQNMINRKKLTVGNHCVKKFMNLDISKHFDAIRRVRKDITKPFNPACLREALNGKIISENECRFYADTWRKRNLTKIEKEWRISINKRILKAKEQNMLHIKISMIMRHFFGVGSGGVYRNNCWSEHIGIRLKQLGNVRIPVNGEKFYDWIRDPGRTPQEILQMLRRKLDRLRS